MSKLQRASNIRSCFSSPAMRTRSTGHAGCAIAVQATAGAAWGLASSRLGSSDGAGARAHFEYALVPLRAPFIPRRRRRRRRPARAPKCPPCVQLRGRPLRHTCTDKDDARVRATGQMPPLSGVLRSIRGRRRSCQDKKARDFKIEYTRRAAADAFVNRDPSDEE